MCAYGHARPWTAVRRGGAGGSAADHQQDAERIRSRHATLRDGVVVEWRPMAWHLRLPRVVPVQAPVRAWQRGPGVVARQRIPDAAGAIIDCPWTGAVGGASGAGDDGVRGQLRVGASEACGRGVHAARVGWSCRAASRARPPAHPCTGLRAVARRPVVLRTATRLSHAVVAPRCAFDPATQRRTHARTRGRRSGRALSTSGTLVPSARRRLAAARTRAVPVARRPARARTPVRAGCTGGRAACVGEGAFRCAQSLVAVRAGLEARSRARRRAQPGTARHHRQAQG